MRSNESEKSIRTESKESLYARSVGDKFSCPITQELMEDPVIAADGHSYERVAIEAWIKRCRDKGNVITSPMTGEPLANTTLIPNINRKNAIREYVEALPDLQRQELEAQRARTPAQKEARLARMLERREKLVHAISTKGLLTHSSHQADQMMRQQIRMQQNVISQMALMQAQFRDQFQKQMQLMQQQSQQLLEVMMKNLAAMQTSLPSPSSISSMAPAISPSSSSRAAQGLFANSSTAVGSVASMGSLSSGTLAASLSSSAVSNSSPRVWRDLSCDVARMLQLAHSRDQDDPRVVDAQAQLGYAYHYGINVIRNPQKAAKWLKLARKRQDLPAGQCALGECYYSGIAMKQDHAAALQCYKKAAAQGYAPAQNNLAFFHDFGIGVSASSREAVRLYRLSAAQGYAKAQFNLGYCYEYGVGVAQNPKEAVKWYRKAADKGYAMAQAGLGVCYQNGFGVVKDMREAVKWHLLAANHGYNFAQQYLGDCYLRGMGVKQNIQEAAKWYRLAARQGNEEAEKMLDSIPKEFKENLEPYQPLKPLFRPSSPGPS